MNKVLLAKEYAKNKHEGQKRTTGEDYYIHCIRVFNILKGRSATENVLIAGLLHDILEDTETTYSELKENFGVRVADIVLECSKPYATLKSKEGLQVKFADMLDNVSDDPKKSWVENKCKMIQTAKRCTP
jgi:(p)ppGpp synthase/HD superfamily hydrolase